MDFCLRWMAVTVMAALLSCSASAGEIAVLQNGFTIRFERRQSFENVTRLYFAEAYGSYVDVQTEDIVKFEMEEPASRPASAVPAPTTRLPLEDVIRSASTKNRLDPKLVVSLIRAESAFDARAVSRKGAQGLMQLMPATSSQLGVRDPLDPEANVQAGTRYLRQLLDRYSDDLIKALAAYNAGPQRVDQYHGLPPYAETRAYVAKIMADFRQQKRVSIGYKREIRRNIPQLSETVAKDSEASASE